MTDRSAAMAAWQAAGTQLVMLPSSVEVRVDLPSVYDLISSGQMPGYLRSLAAKFMGDDELTSTDLTDEEREKWEDFERLLITQTVVAFKPPGMAETPGKITMDDLKADPCPIPRDDLQALRNMALRIQTPAMVDAFSRVAAMETDLRLEREAGLDDPDVIAEREQAIRAQAEQAAAVIRSETKNTVAGWATFRRLRGSRDAGVTGKGVGLQAIEPRDHRGPGGRPRVRRRPEREAAPSAKRAPVRKRSKGAPATGS